MEAFTPVPVGALPPARLGEVLPPAELARVEASAREVTGLMHGRVLWNVNSTAVGGGVAEMLRPLLSYARGAGVDARWRVLRGSPEFFAVTKRLHNRLHGVATADALGSRERAVYDETCRAAGAALAGSVAAADVVILHDPQTAGMIPALAARGIPVIWRCHVGVDTADATVESAIQFLLPYVQWATRTVFSRESYIWSGVDRSRVRIIAPSIDPLSAKNHPMDAATVGSILVTAGVCAGRPTAAPVFSRSDGSRGRVDGGASMVEDHELTLDHRVVMQVSRWDRLKDHVGVMEGFARHLDPGLDCELLLAGPHPASIQDDPEASEVLQEIQQARRALPPERRARVHLALLQMDDAEENAAIVNALQRQATIVVQKSLAEGFGLTVAEAMWKGRPVVASAIGGILDQVDDHATGILVDPRDLPAFGRALDELLRHPARADEMGRAAHERVRKEFLSSRHMFQYLDLLREILRP